LAVFLSETVDQISREFYGIMAMGTMTQEQAYDLLLDNYPGVIPAHRGLG
jgi:hypothetical protein